MESEDHADYILCRHRRMHPESNEWWCEDDSGGEEDEQDEGIAEEQSWSSIVESSPFPFTLLVV